MIQAFESFLAGKNCEQPQDSHSATWATRNSPTTEIFPGGQADKQGVINWGPGGHYEATRRTTALFRLSPTADDLRSGNTRKWNAHATPALPGSWFWGGGPSPVAMDFFASPMEDDKGHQMFEGLTFSAEPTGSSIEGIGGQYHWTVIDLADWKDMIGGDIDLELEIGWGHIHLPGTEGYFIVYRDGDPTPIVEVRDINTHFLNDYRDDGSGNVPPKPAGGQTGVSLWGGDYLTPSASFPAEILSRCGFTISRLGVDLEEAKLDGVAWPIEIFSHTVQDTHSTAGGPSSHMEVSPAMDPAEFKVRGGNGGGGTPSPPPGKLNPKLCELPSGLIEMTWTPDPECFGYRFYVDNLPVSKSSNPLQHRTTFSAPGPGSHTYGISAAYEADSEALTHPEPDGPTDFRFTPEDPQVGEPVLFEVTNPATRTDYSWDRTADDIADYHGLSFTYAYTSKGIKTVKLLADGAVIQTKTLNVT